MKKFFAMMMIVCLMASMLCVTAFAAEETDWGKVNTEEIEIDPNIERNDGASGVWCGTASGTWFGTGSMLGNGSLAMLVALASFATSIVSIGLVVDMRKKLVSVTANKESEDEES